MFLNLILSRVCVSLVIHELVNAFAGLSGTFQVKEIFSWFLNFIIKPTFGTDFSICYLLFVNGSSQTSEICLIVTLKLVEVRRSSSSKSFVAFSFLWYQKNSFGAYKIGFLTSI